ncbi:hypothetical protein QR680_006019 [Steinernema hermaphroditum]|uniref:C-type lectin domain-containing protein n=1 Tax=Steinernema hermaphroditum TaxID=289476 RepID=A0AA39HU01_9BILA|nr:hypothetical protein QR680_006019 [Steinernema hermaphroditum]
MRLLLLLLFPFAFATPALRLPSTYRQLCEHAKIGDICFYFVTEFSTFHGAENACRGYGGELASIRNMYENQILAHKAFFLAHGEVRTNNFWIGAQYSDNLWKWIDGLPMSYHNFANPEDVVDPPYACLAIEATNSWNFNGLWLPTFCNSVAPFVCEVRKTESFPPTTPAPSTTSTTTALPTTTTTTTTTTKAPTKPTTTTTKKATTTTTLAPTTTTTPKPATVITTTVSPGCGGQTRPCFHGHVYIVNQWPLSWKKAEENCVQKGGHLTSILSAEEGEFVAWLAAAGFLKFDIWIGGERVSGNFKWVDGSKWDYTLFNGDQPNDVARNNCLQIFDANHKKWANYDCDRPYPSICKIKV